MKRANGVRFKDDPLYPGWRVCAKQPRSLHHPDFLYCDCMRPKPTVPRHARPFSFGKLRT